MVNYIALGTALVLSAIAGFFSVVGLATIFSGAYVAVLIMAGALETAKVVTVSWMSRNWDGCPKPIKYYLTVSVVVLMLITSMGIFGYLSKAHLETNSVVELAQLQIAPLQSQIDSEQIKIANAQSQLSTMESVLAQTSQRDSNWVYNTQKSSRAELANQINDSLGRIQILNEQLLPLKTTQAATQAELGPLKYIAEVIYGDEAEQHFDSAVRFIILIIVLVFDPLAIVLLIASTHGLKPKSRLTFNAKSGKLEVNR